MQSDYNPDGYIISKKLIFSGKKFLITNRKKIELHCPVRLIHGSADKEVSLNNSIEIFNKIKSRDVELIIIKNGDHRLSNPNNLKTILSTLQSLVEKNLT
jgi:dipeptidyl aminopeptidase/acylaminoacyl peptidase